MDLLLKKVEIIENLNEMLGNLGLKCCLTMRSLKDGLFMDLDESFFNITGYSRTFILQDPKIWEERVHPSDLSQYRSNLRVAENRGKTVFSYRVKNVSGIYISLKESLFKVQTDPYLIGMLTSHNNKKSQSLQAKIATRSVFYAQEHKIFEIMIQKVSTALVILGRDKRVVWLNWSAEELLGSVRSKLIGTRLPFGDKLSGRVYDMIYELSLGPNKGNKKNLIVNTHPISWNKNQSILVTLDDRTEIKRHLDAQRDKLESQRKSKAMSAFLAHISHEIRTPLNSIIGINELLQETENNPDNSDLLKRQQSSGNALLGILNDVLDISKINAHQVVLEKVEIDIRYLTKSLESMFYDSAERKAIILSHTIEHRVPKYVQGDKLRVRQILINLLGNAVKFTEKGSITLSIQAERGPNNVIIIFSLSDTGAGIPKESLSTIFDGFSQADASITRKYGGTGLGLTIAKKLCELMGGSISVQSTVGKGTIFRAKIPFGIYKRQSVSQVKSSKAVIDNKKLPVLKILAVDDAVDNRFLLEKYFKSTPFAVDFAVNGIEAVELAQNHPYDLILMDMQMPEMDGKTATQNIRKKEKTHTPIIALTAHAFSEEVKSILESGCDAHLAKPVKKSDLIAIILKYAPKQL